MAVMNDDFSLQGGFGNLSAYKRRGFSKTIVRTKGGGDKSKIKTAAKCAVVRQLNTEFGGTSQCGKEIKKAIPEVQRLADSLLSSSLTNLSRHILLLDTENTTGQRNIVISQHRSLLEGFQYNKDLYLETVIRQPVSYSISRNNLSASVTLPELIPGITFYIPGKYPMFRFIVALGIVPDMMYTSHGSCGYEPTGQNLDASGRNMLTDWAPTSTNNAGQTIEIQLRQGALPDDTCSLILALGIEFGMPVTNLLVNPIKHSGCAKILALA